MREANFGEYHIRKWFTYLEDTLATETGALADGNPVRKIVIAAAIHNPYAGRYSEDLSQIVQGSAKLGLQFGRRIQDAAAGRPVESYGKACLVGTGGEYEHGNAFLTQVLADPVRDAVGGGKAWVPSTGKRAAPGTSIDVPLAHKDALYVRSHYDAVTFSIPAAPRPDELVIAVAVASGGRPHERVGGLRAADAIGDGLH